MGEAIALALKFGVGAMPAILAEYGVLTALVAFVVFMPLGHFTVGLVLALVALFIPRFPDKSKVHQVKAGVGGAKIDVKGNSRTVMLGLGALVMVLSVVEGIIRQ